MHPFSPFVGKLVDPSALLGSPSVCSFAMLRVHLSIRLAVHLVAHHCNPLVGSRLLSAAITRFLPLWSVRALSHSLLCTIHALSLALTRALIRSFSLWRARMIHNGVSGSTFVLLNFYALRRRFMVIEGS